MLRTAQENRAVSRLTSFQRLGRFVFACACLLALICTTPQVSFAGQESILRDQDVVLVVDSRWPGNAYGGYFPLRIRLSNLGPPRDLTLVFDANDTRDVQLPEVRRSVRVEQQATINLTLSIPMVSEDTSGRLRVFDSELGELKGLYSSHPLPDFGGAIPRTSLLVISSTNLDDKQLQPFEDAAATESSYLRQVTASGGSPYYGRSGFSNPINEKDHLVIQPAQNLPVNWIDYSGVDLVAVAWSDWTGKLSTAEREAILKWAATGGVLVFFQTGEPAAKLNELNRVLQLTPHEVDSWMPANSDDYKSTNIITSAELRAGAVSGISVGMSAPVAPDERKPENPADGWMVNPGTFSYRDWSLGRIYVFPANPFPGTGSNWAWWLASIPKNLGQWPNKMGMSSRQGNAEFLNFVIPGIGSVPVFAFLTLITLFTLVIGPLNYYWLHKKRRLALMVFTVPLIAGVTCILLFSYSLVADGFSIRSRVNSFTWLDQQRKSAVSASRLCLYAPFAPSAGLTFSPECAVFPCWRRDQAFESGALNWSGNDQRFSSGWFRSQTWTQFQTLEHRDERGRLDFTPPANPDAPTLTASNGLSWDLEFLAIDATGNSSESRWYIGEKVPAGATAQLNRASETDIKNFVDKYLDGRKWEYPPGIEAENSSGPLFTRGRYRGYPGYGGFETLRTDLRQGLMGRNLPFSKEIDAVPVVEGYDWREGRNMTLKQSHAATRRPHFWAISRKNPGIQLGIKSSVDTKSLHILSGTF